jgi:ketosteroid isomerase-like protein
VVTDADIENLRAAYRSLEETGAIREDLFAHDFLLEQTPGILDTRGTFRGPAGMAAALSELRTGFDEIHFEPHDFEPHGDWLQVPVTFVARARGVEQEARIVHLWKLRDGLIARMRVIGQADDVPRVLAKLQAEG